MEEGEAETDSEGAEQVGEGEGSEWESDDEDVGVWRVLAEEREGIEARRMERRLKKTPPSVAEECRVGPGRPHRSRRRCQRQDRAETRTIPDWWGL